jgi:hypothetical protein
MGKLAELLAGCPRSEASWEKPGEWKTVRAFPGFMAHRLYIILSRPKEAIREFGAGDYKTPLFFFLFFTVILAVLQYLASQLQWAVFMLFGPPTIIQPGLPEVLGIIFSPSILIIAQIERTVYAILFLGISTIILALSLWLITGIRTWNPAFTICAYSLPVPLLLGTMLAFVQVSRLIPEFLSEYVGLAFALAGIIFTVVIAGYGIQALTKIPIITAVVVALFWVVIGSMVIGGMLELVILPLENGLREQIAMMFFPGIFLRM